MKIQRDNHRRHHVASGDGRSTKGFMPNSRVALPRQRRRRSLAAHAYSVADRVDKVMTAARPALTGGVAQTRARMTCAGNGVIQGLRPRQADSGPRHRAQPLASLTKPSAAGSDVQPAGVLIPAADSTR